MTTQQQALRETAARATRPVAVKALIKLMAVQGVSGIGGGVALASDPSGGNVGYPVSWLEGTPFNDYLIPGLILGLLLGVAPLLAVYGLLRRPLWRWTDVWNGWTGQHWAWTGSRIIGIGLVAWILIEVLVIPDHSAGATALQLFFGLLGAAILSVTAAKPVRRYYRSR
jgi:hypothetical protein